MGDVGAKSAESFTIVRPMKYTGSLGCDIHAHSFFFSDHISLLYVFPVHPFSQVTPFAAPGTAESRGTFYEKFLFLLSVTQQLPTLGPHTL